MWDHTEESKDTLNGFLYSIGYNSLQIKWDYYIGP